MLLESALLFSTPAATKAQCLVHLIFNSTLQLINGISSDHQKLLRYFNGTVMAVFFRIPLLPSATVFPNNLALYLKDLKALVLAIIAFKFAASPLG